MLFLTKRVETLEHLVASLIHNQNQQLLLPAPPPPPPPAVPPPPQVMGAVTNPSPDRWDHVEELAGNGPSPPPDSMLDWDTPPPPPAPLPPHNSLSLPVFLPAYVPPKSPTPITPAIRERPDCFKSKIYVNRPIPEVENFNGAPMSLVTYRITISRIIRESMCDRKMEAIDIMARKSCYQPSHFVIFFIFINRPSTCYEAPWDIKRPVFTHVAELNYFIHQYKYVMRCFYRYLNSGTKNPFSHLVQPQRDEDLFRTSQRKLVLGQICSRLDFSI